MNQYGNHSSRSTYTRMSIEPTTLSQFGAWGQIGSVGFAVISWYLEIHTGFLAFCIGYFVVTLIGIVGMTREESGITGALVYPFLLPGLVPLYYFAT